MAALFAASRARAAAVSASPTSGVAPRLVQALIGGSLVLIGRRKNAGMLGRLATAAGFSLLATSVEGSRLTRVFTRA
jgi:hypothetical protein